MTKDILFEIGLEELPARFVDDAEQQLADKTKKWLQNLRISFSGITAYSTPRRLAVYIQDAATKQETIEEEVKGPAIKIAKDKDGNWSKAAIGFTKGQGKTTEDIYIKDVKGIEYIFVKKHIEGQDTIDLLPAFKEIVLALQFAKNMRWGEETIRYARPIRWLVALFGNDIIPLEIAHVCSGNKTNGHRFLGREIILNNPSDYVQQLEENYVIADAGKRRQMIVDGIHQLEQEKGVMIPIDSDLLKEVTNLVEYPTVFMGSYDESFLKVPEEALVTSMKEHQRYFPVKSSGGKLLAHFAGVRNGNADHLNTVIRGNEKVLRARLSDAQFFYEEDQKHSIAFYLDKLTKVVFQDKLGTIHEKTDRVIQIAAQIANMLGITSEEKQRTIRAAEICKFDLMTNMVNEFTELQGIMGEKYAVIFGEEQQVAKAIAEHYLPNHASGQLPATLEGAIVSLADKLDTIVGCISVGLIPTGSADPYGLRRKAIGILRILENKKWDISVEQLIELTQHIYSSTDIEMIDAEKTTEDLFDFLKLRVHYLLKEAGIEQDIIHAVIADEIGVFSYTESKAAVLSAKRNDSTFKETQDAFTRTLNLAKKSSGHYVDKHLFETESEKQLNDKFNEIKVNYQAAKQQLKAIDAMKSLSELTTYIHAFFEHNMVMAEDELVRANRLALLAAIAAVIRDFGDVTRIEWKQHF